MKKYLFSAVFVLCLGAFLISCGKTSSNFINVSMPNFKPQTPIATQEVHSGVKINLEVISVEQNNNYTDYFENSTLKIRIDREIELLKQNLEEQMKTIAKLKNYELGGKNAAYTLKSVVKVYIDEKDAKKTSEWLNGDSISSNLSLSFEAKMDLLDNKNSQNTTTFTSRADMDSAVGITYPIKSDEGVGMFKTTFSAVPTQLNKGLERPAFELDKTFLAFYKTTLSTLYDNLPKATNSSEDSTQGEEFNEFINDDSFNESFQTKEAEPQSTQNTSSKFQSNEQEDGVIIFE